MSRFVPVVLKSVVTLSGPGFTTLYTMRPLYCVVVGPGGKSVGNIMSPAVPVSVTVRGPSEFMTVFRTEPVGRMVTERTASPSEFSLVYVNV